VGLKIQREPSREPPLARPMDNGRKSGTVVAGRDAGDPNHQGAQRARSVSRVESNWYLAASVTSLQAVHAVEGALGGVSPHVPLIAVTLSRSVTP